MDLDLFSGQVDEKNLVAAHNYLSLLLSPGVASMEVKHLREHGDVVDTRVNDIVRAAGGVPWPWDDPGVKRELVKSLSGKKLSPPILVSRSEDLVIADGSHRVSFAYHVDPFMMIPVFIAP